MHEIEEKCSMQETLQRERETDREKIQKNKQLTFAFLVS